MQNREGSWLLVHTVSLHPQYTLLRYAGDPGPDAPFAVLAWKGQHLQPLGAWPSTSLPSGEHLLAFPPLSPPGAGLLTLEMAAVRAPATTLRTRAFEPANLGQGWEVGSWNRDGARLEVTVTSMLNFWLTDKAVLEDWTGGITPLTVEYLGRSGPDGRRQWRLSHPELPPMNEQQTKLMLTVIPQDRPPFIMDIYLEDAKE